MSCSRGRCHDRCVVPHSRSEQDAHKESCDECAKDVEVERFQSQERDGEEKSRRLPLFLPWMSEEVPPSEDFLIRSPG